MPIASPQNVVEAALLSAVEPLTLSDIQKIFNHALDVQEIRAILTALQELWQDRALELVVVASGWRFQTKKEVQPFLERLQIEKPQKYSRAVLETLAIIAYQQPVTRGDIESIRGVSVASSVVKTLEERGWVDVVGHRDAPGRPALLATTKQFLNDFGLQSLNDLPELVSEDSVSQIVQNLEQHADDNPPEVLTMGMALTAGTEVSLEQDFLLQK